MLDYVALDIKTTLDDQYTKAIGKKEFDFSLIEKTIKFLLKSKIPFELRTTVVPGIHDKKILNKTARQLKKIIGKKKIKWYLQNFRPTTCLDPKYEKRDSYKPKKMREFLKATKSLFPEAELRAA